MSEPTTYEAIVPDEIMLESVKRLTLNPGDVLVCHVQRMLTSENVQRFKDALDGVFPDNKVVVMQDVELTDVEAGGA